MAEYTDLFNARSLAAQMRKLDIDDLNHAIAGVDVGRMRKHILQSEIDPRTGRKNSASERLARTLQWLLLNDENYALAHRAAVTATKDAMDTAAQALSDVKAALMQTTADIEDILDRAATLPDGRKVFRDENGNVVYQDGNAVSSELAETIIWLGDEPKYEEFRAKMDRKDDLRLALNELLGIETELGGYQGELGNNENPPARDRLDDIKDRSDELRDRVNQIQSKLTATSAADATVKAPTDSPDISLGDQSSVPEIKLGG